MKRLLVPLLLGLTLIPLAATNLLVPLFPSLRAFSLQWGYGVRILWYLCFVLLVALESADLETFHIDRLTVGIFIVIGVYRSEINVEGESLFQIALYVLSAVLLGVFITKWKSIPASRPRWFILVLLLSLFAIPLRYVEALQVGKYQNYHLFANDAALTFIRGVVYNLSFVAPFEEMIFRGILWGQLRRWAWSESRIFWTQALLFWIIHFWQISTPATLLITLPIVTLILSLLARYSRQLYPSILFHAIMNSLTPLLAYLALR